MYICVRQALFVIVYKKFTKFLFRQTATRSPHGVPQGSLNEFGWLTEENVTSCKKLPRFQTRSHRRVAPRFCLFASLNSQNFDYGLCPSLRMTYRGFVCCCLLCFAGRRGCRPLQKLFCTIRVNVFSVFIRPQTRELFEIS